MRKLITSMPAGHVDLSSVLRNFIHTTFRIDESLLIHLKKAISLLSPLQVCIDVLESLFQEKMIPVVLTHKANR